MVSAGGPHSSLLSGAVLMISGAVLMISGSLSALTQSVLRLVILMVSSVVQHSLV